MKYSISKSAQGNRANSGKRFPRRREGYGSTILKNILSDNSGWLSLLGLLAGLLIFIFSMKQCEENTSVEAYLSKYNFEKARKAAQKLSDGPTSAWDGHVTSHVFNESDKAKAMHLIISQECAYSIQQKQYEKI